MMQTYRLMKSEHVWEAQEHGKHSLRVSEEIRSLRWDHFYGFCIIANFMIFLLTFKIFPRCLLSFKDDTSQGNFRTFVFLVKNNFTQGFVLRLKANLRYVSPISGQYYVIFENKYVATQLPSLFGRLIWGKLPECIYESFEIARVKRGQFQNFQKSRG